MCGALGRTARNLLVREVEGVLAQAACQLQPGMQLCCRSCFLVFIELFFMVIKHTPDFTILTILQSRQRSSTGLIHSVAQPSLLI